MLVRTRSLLAVFAANSCATAWRLVQIVKMNHHASVVGFCSLILLPIDTFEVQNATRVNIDAKQTTMYNRCVFQNRSYATAISIASSLMMRSIARTISARVKANGAHRNDDVSASRMFAMAIDIVLMARTNMIASRRLFQNNSTGHFSCQSCSGSDKALCHNSTVCISKSIHCDGHDDCPNAEDEVGCPGYCKLEQPIERINCSDGKSYPKRYACSGMVPECQDSCRECDPELAFRCKSTGTCISKRAVCSTHSIDCCFLF